MCVFSGFPSVVLVQVRKFYQFMGICFSTFRLWELEVSFTWREQMLKVLAPASLIPNTLEEEKRSMTQIGIFLMVRKAVKGSKSAFIMKCNNRLIYEEKQLLGLYKMCAWKCRFLYSLISSNIPPILTRI